MEARSRGPSGPALSRLRERLNGGFLVYQIVEMEDTVRIPPNELGEDLDAVAQELVHRAGDGQTEYFTPALLQLHTHQVTGLDLQLLRKAVGQ